jgi:hypothetical protein
VEKRFDYGKEIVKIEKKNDNVIEIDGEKKK